MSKAMLNHHLSMKRAKLISAYAASPIQPIGGRPPVAPPARVPGLKPAIGGRMPPRAVSF